MRIPSGGLSTSCTLQPERKNRAALTNCSAKCISPGRTFPSIREAAASSSLPTDLTAGDPEAAFRARRSHRAAEFPEARNYSPQGIYLLRVQAWARPRRRVLWRGPISRAQSR